MHTIFDCAERWELVGKNPINLVRVKGASKRQKTPRVLTPEQFCLLPPLIVEPYRTQVWIAGCLGLRPSEIMPLRWDDFDFENGTLLCIVSSFETRPKGTLRHSLRFPWQRDSLVSEWSWQEKRKRALLESNPPGISCRRLIPMSAGE
jgi:integrase